MAGNVEARCLEESAPRYCYPAGHTLTNPQGDARGNRRRIVTTWHQVQVDYSGNPFYFDYHARPEEFKDKDLGFRLAQDSD